MNLYFSLQGLLLLTQSNAFPSLTLTSLRRTTSAVTGGSTNGKIHPLSFSSQGIHRGGAFTDITSSSSSSSTAHYDSSSSYDESSSDSEHDESYDAVDIDVVTNKDRSGNTAAQSARKMSNFAMNPIDRFKLSKSYFLSSMLWLSVTMDIVNNKKKRCLLLPGAQEVGGRIASSNIVATVCLASGFVLAATVSYLLSLEFKKEDKGLSASSVAEDTTTTLAKGDTGDYEYFTSNENVRKRMHLFILLFGLINQGANLNPSSAPFLGMSGFVINVHNSLIAFSAWKKDTIVEGQTVKRELMDIGQSALKGFLPSKSKSINIHIKSWQRFLSTAFSLGSGVAILRAIGIIGSSLVPYYLNGMVSFNLFEFIIHLGRGDGRRKTIQF